MTTGAHPRDEGRRIISTATKWVAAAAVGATGLFSLMAAALLPGKSHTAQPPATPQVSTPNTGSGGSGATSNTSNTTGSQLQAPPAPPSQSSGQASVATGGS